MAGRPTVFDATVVEVLAEEIRRGAYAWVAAEAAGISKRTFYRWIERGERGEEPFAGLEARVRQARAQARMGAEQRVREQSPLSWLRLGPGRERADEPGWTQAVVARGEPRVKELSEQDAELLKVLEGVLEEVGQEEESAGVP